MFLARAYILNNGTFPAGRFFSLNGELAIAANRQSKI